MSRAAHRGRRSPSEAVVLRPRAVAEVAADGALGALRALRLAPLLAALAALLAGGDLSKIKENAKFENCKR